VLLARELDAFAREVDAFPDDERLWQTVPGISNSCGNLALHAAGNLEHFVGAILGGTGYVRNRDEEFSRRSGTRAELVAGLARAREVVTHVLDALPAEAWEREYPEPVGGVRLPTGTVLLHLLSHLAHHLGQAGYLRRVLTGENRSVTSSALADLGARLEAARGR
jgi:uncharacterized damage-inducible protein DinB